MFEMNLPGFRHCACSSEPSRQSGLKSHSQFAGKHTPLSHEKPLQSVINVGECKLIFIIYFYIDLEIFVMQQFI